METVSLIIAEHGGNWLAWARKLHAQQDELVVLVQASDEPTSEFSRRVIHRIRSLRQAGAHVSQAAMVGGIRCDSAQRHQRSKILRKLTALLSDCGCAGQLYLDPAAEADRPSRNLMAAIAWALRDLTRGSGVSISVQPLST